ncbi:Solute carrier 49 member 4 [Branchiostoma belcheri]|nr:Solute carrier 49 member 4 [Branchiostoma belcheri]
MYWAVSLYVSIILSGLFVNGAVPLFYEMAAEITYPIPEAVSSTVLIWSNCFFAGIFLLIPMIPGVDGDRITYPIPEAVSSTVLIWSNCFFGGIFHYILMIPGVGTLWMTWCILGAFLLSLPLLMFLRGNYQRLRVDQGQPNPVQHN